MATWRLKACPRCRGDTYIDSDIDGWYQQCLLCGYRRELKEVNVRKRVVAIGTAKEDTEGN